MRLDHEEDRLHDQQSSGMSQPIQSGMTAHTILLTDIFTGYRCTATPEKERSNVQFENPYWPSNHRFKIHAGYISGLYVRLDLET